MLFQKRVLSTKFDIYVFYSHVHLHEKSIIINEVYPHLAITSTETDAMCVLNATCYENSFIAKDPIMIFSIASKH